MMIFSTSYRQVYQFQLRAPWIMGMGSATRADSDLVHTCTPGYGLGHSGATDSAYDGRYERLADHECLGAPVYQLGGSGGSVLYRSRNDFGDWYVGSDAFIADCRNSG